MITSMVTTIKLLKALIQAQVIIVQAVVIAIVDNPLHNNLLLKIKANLNLITTPTITHKINHLRITAIKAVQMVIQINRIRVVIVHLTRHKVTLRALIKMLTIAQIHPQIIRLIHKTKLIITRGTAVLIILRLIILTVLVIAAIQTIKLKTAVVAQTAQITPLKIRVIVINHPLLNLLLTSTAVNTTCN